MSQTGVERLQEIGDSRIYVDVRSASQRAADALKDHDTVRNIMIGLVVLAVIIPILIPLIMMTGAGIWMYYKWSIREFRMPVRYPEWIAQTDPSERDDNMGNINGRGLEFMGVERRGRSMRKTWQIWASDSDVRTHRIIMGTTGAGKTQALLSILFNPLCFGSGFSMTDGKAQIDVTANIFVMAWLFWREDDVLVMNYMRGGQDRFRDMVNRPKVGVRKTRVSNTWNPFSSANHETINQIIDSIMEKAGGDGAQWQAKAINMKNALVQTIAYLRASGSMMMSVSAIREQMALDNMIKLALRTDLPPAAAAAIRSYLGSGLPGFQWNKAKQGKPQDQETYLQHGYLTGQFTRTLGLMTDTYYDIFGDEIPEFDTSDLILNNRISMTMIPTLEKGVEEAGNLGKMQVASIKMMMAENLGYEIEGIYEEVVDNRQTNTHRPYYIALDELGYYFAPGIDLMFAQGRSLNIALIAAGQDFQAMAKNFKSEVESMIANTRFKQSMKLEDPKETFEIFSKAAGQGATARLHGYEYGDGGLIDNSPGITGAKSINIEQADRISLQELKRLGPGDGVMIVGDKVIRYKGFNLFMKLKFDKKKVNIRINTFLTIAKPSEFGEIASLCRNVNDSKQAVANRLISLLSSRTPPNWSGVSTKTNHPAFRRFVDFCAHLESNHINISPNHRGISLFVELRNLLKNSDEAKDSSRIEVEPDTDQDTSVSNFIESDKPAKRLPVEECLNDSPIVLKADTNTLGLRNVFLEGKVENPDWEQDVVPAPASSSDAVDLNDELGDLTSNEEKDRIYQLKLAKSTKRSLSRVAGMMADIEGKKSADINQEILATEHLIERSCEFTKAGVGANKDPRAVDNQHDILQHLDDLTKMLS